MTDLKCGVESCVYNREYLCSRNEITVEGRSAKRARQTACASFEMQDGAMTNSAFSEPVSLETHIRCSALSCVFNGRGDCTAEHITVAGIQDARKRGDTECASFEMK